MNSHIYEAKTKEAALEMALQELNVDKEDLIINKVDEKNSLLKRVFK